MAIGNGFRCGYPCWSCFSLNWNGKNIELGYQKSHGMAWKVNHNGKYIAQDLLALIKK